MLKIKFTEAEVEQLYQQFMEHLSGMVKKKLHVIYLKLLGLPHYEIARIAQISGDRVTAYLKNMMKVAWQELACCVLTAQLVHYCLIKIKSRRIFKNTRPTPSQRLHMRLKNLSGSSLP